MTTPAPPPSKEERWPRIRVPRDIYDRLEQEQRPRESLADVLRRLLGKDRDANPPVLS